MSKPTKKIMLLCLKCGMIIIVAYLSLLFGSVQLASSRVMHSGFSFGDINGNENQDIEILNYRYGDDKTAPTRPADWQLASGHVPQRMSMGSFLPPADSLYVKWRVKSTGEIMEDTVDLTKRVPWNMNNKELHFLIKKKQLYVYVIEYVQESHSPFALDCPAASYKTCKCTEIYPGHWSNF